MKCNFLLSLGFGLWIFSLGTTPILGSYDSGPGYGVAHSSYPAAPLAHGHGHGQGWNSGHSAGSYYHYHVPLVGQQQSHYPPQPQPQQDHHLYLLLPLLLLAALPLLFLPILPLLLLPLGLSLLALLLPLLMGGMMMMMMMMGGGMMMPMMMRNPSSTYNHNGESRDFGFGFGHLVLHDLEQLMNRYARSLDLDACPERIACEAGSFIFPENATESVTAKTLMNFLVEQATPKGRARRILRSYKQAFWTGSKTGNCSQFTCQPKFRIFTSSPPPPPQSPHQYSSSSENVNYNNTTSAKANFPYADYYNLYGGGDYYHQNSTNLNNYYKYYNNPGGEGAASGHFPTYVSHPSQGSKTGTSSTNFYGSYNYNNKKPTEQQQQKQPGLNAWKTVTGQLYETGGGEANAGAYAENEIRSLKS